ncbi:NADH:flavin oxidoreductase [Halodesulfovibrio marinisediminis]|uniref:2,4-dienoyl-CoA reductase n=1 Tax=Halodesulfovibrio marinisediminis DSM 17456 TaxID=1121457 RepID=A0A1N6IJA4_9BACT|nr:NADH:flavin oxidoreductase [Halodesulfovibrio marinisediminis]SIO32087.1 2,4-dienoyl-CoA reductase [Halodesulfovibrio marinisediminis DSM 17456]
MLYDKLTINGMTVPNRLVRSATWEGLASTEGFVTPALENVMLELIDGGVGMIITGHIFVAEQGRAGERQLAIYGDEYIKGLRSMVQKVHDRDGLIVAQLAHAGGQAAQAITGMPALGPSPFVRRDGESCQEMTENDIDFMVYSFQQAAARAVAAGFDGVQIHAAHGYGLSQFLSPHINKRTDMYGGSLENRIRPLVRVYEAIRYVVGDKYPVMMKINCEDYIEGGLLLEDSASIIQGLEMIGLDAVEISGGLLTNGPTTSSVRIGRFDTPSKEAWYREATRVVRDRTKLPIMLVGGIRSFSVANGLLSEGLIDFVSMSRPLLREPDLLKRWSSGDLRRAECISCNKCFSVLHKNEGYFCPIARTESPESHVSS